MSNYCNNHQKKRKCNMSKCNVCKCKTKSVAKTKELSESHVLNCLNHKVKKLCHRLLKLECESNKNKNTLLEICCGESYTWNCKNTPTESAEPGHIYLDISPNPVRMYIHKLNLLGNDLTDYLSSLDQGYFKIISVDDPLTQGTYSYVSSDPVMINDTFCFEVTSVSSYVLESCTENTLVKLCIDTNTQLNLD